MNNILPALAPTLVVRELHSATDLHATKWGAVDVYTIPEAGNGLYQVGIAGSDRVRDMALGLRYEIFNVELGEGLMSSRESGLDRDQFDDQMTHLVLIEKATGDVVGTYRLQTMTTALDNAGIYSAQEYDLASLAPIFHESVECGRACVAKGHRSLTSMLLLWKGIRAFIRLQNQRYLFGCCSLTTLDPDDGWRAMKTLRRQKALHRDYFVTAMPAYSCGNAARERDPQLGEAIPLPKLFGAYMRLGCKVCSEPAIDREFGTVDFLILLDSHAVSLSSLAALLPTRILPSFKRD